MNRKRSHDVHEIMCFICLIFIDTIKTYKFENNVQAQDKISKVMKICSETPKFYVFLVVILHKHTISTILKHKDLHRMQFMCKFCKCDVKEIGVLLLPVGFVLK